MNDNSIVASASPVECIVSNASPRKGKAAQKLTMFVIMGNALKMSDKSLERERPPSVNGAEEQEEVIDVESHMNRREILILLRVQFLNTAQPPCKIIAILSGLLSGSRSSAKNRHGTHQ